MMRVKTPVALALMKILAPETNDISPQPSLAEKTEAALGLCRMHWKLEKYQPDATVYLVGRFLMEFVAEYRNDQPKFAGKNKQPPLLPWSDYALRLEDSLRDLQSTTHTYPAHKANVDLLVRSSRDILHTMRTHGRVGPPVVLIGVVTRMWPQATSFAPYEGVPALQIRMPSAR